MKLFLKGTIEAKMGCRELNRLLSCLNMPPIDHKLYGRYLKVIGPAITKVTEETCAEARQEERKLVVEKMKQLCQDLWVALNRFCLFHLLILGLGQLYILMFLKPEDKISCQRGCQKVQGWFRHRTNPKGFWRVRSQSHGLFSYPESKFLPAVLKRGSGVISTLNKLKGASEIPKSLFSLFFYFFTMRKFFDELYTSHCSKILEKNTVCSKIKK